MDRHISAPVGRETAEELRAGDYVYITGTIYTARDVKGTSGCTKRFVREETYLLI